MSAPASQGLLVDCPSVSLERQVAAIRREIRLRHQRYPRLIACRRMSARKAADELAAMQAVLATLLELLEVRA